MTAVRLFVYGSLKRGFENENHLAAAEFERPAATASGFTLYDLGAFPALSWSGDAASRVHGELYSVSLGELALLDDFEGYPELYQREDIPLEDGTRATAYLMSQAAVRRHAVVPGGLWTAVRGARGAGADQSGPSRGRE